jgi:hypothetical protein
MKHMSVRQVISGYDAADKKASSVFLAAKDPAFQAFKLTIETASAAHQSALEEVTRILDAGLAEVRQASSTKKAEIEANYAAAIKPAQDLFAESKKLADDRWYAESGALPGVCKTPDVTGADITAKDPDFVRPHEKPLRDEYAIAVTYAQSQYDSSTRHLTLTYKEGLRTLLADTKAREEQLYLAFWAARKQADTVCAEAKEKAEADLKAAIFNAEGAFNYSRTQRYDVWTRFVAAYDRTIASLESLSK